MAIPKTLTELVGLDELVADVNGWADTYDWPQALLFYGPPGTGKTSSAHVIARTLLDDWFNDMNFIESNASDDRGIDFIRNELKSAMRSKPLGTPRKIILLDEADGLTPSAQDAMRQLIEKYSHNAMVIMTCNELEKIRPAIRSRCKAYAFTPVPAGPGAMRLLSVLPHECLLEIRAEYSTDERRKLVEKLQNLIELMNGDMRASIMFLDSIDIEQLGERLSRLEETMGEDAIAHAIGDEWWKVRNNFHEMLKNGRSLHQVMRNFYLNIYDYFDEEDNLDSIWDIMAAYGDVMTHRYTWPGDDYSYCDYAVAKMREKVKKNE